MSLDEKGEGKPKEETDGTSKPGGRSDPGVKGFDVKGRPRRPKPTPSPSKREGASLTVEGSSVSSGRDTNVKQESHFGDERHEHHHTEHHEHYYRPQETEKTLSAVGYKLSKVDISCARSVTECLDDYLSQLKKERLILISCVDEEIAQNAACAIINKLEISDDESRLGLKIEKFEKVLGEGSFTIHSLLELKADTGAQTGILVDALKGDAQRFSDSLFGTKMNASFIKNTLNDKGLFVICVAESNAIQRRLINAPENLKFPHWPIDFLRPLLEPHFPDPARQADLEEKLLEQRKQGKWREDESEFCLQVKRYIASGKLAEVVDGGGPHLDSGAIAEMLKNGGPIRKVVLYAATFFQEITRTEFCCVVEALLGDRMVTIVAPPYKHICNGSNGVQKEVPLVQIWEEEKDEIFREWLCETTPSKDAGRIVTFCDPGFGDFLKRRLEDEHLFYLIDKFKAIQEQGVFFYPSPRITESTTRLAIDMAIAYPDEYGTSWITEMILKLRLHFEAESNGAGNAADSMFRFLKGSKRAAKRRAYSRISELIRQMIEYPQLRKVADSSLDDLIREKCHDSALIIVKQLRFATEFDDLYWIKQILDRGNERVRSQAYEYLYSYVKGMDAGIYQALTRLDSWLPKEDQEKYSSSNLNALCLFIDFCWETIETFDSKDYGKWPSLYPLFAFKDRETAVSNLALLVRWLLHPGIARALAEEVTPLHMIGSMVAAWTFILLGSKGKISAAATGDGNTTGAISSVVNVDASSVWDILLREIVSKTDASQRAELRTYWESLHRFLAEGVTAYPYASDERREFFWKCDLIDTLKRRFLTLGGK